MKRILVLLALAGLLLGATYYPSDDLVVFKGGVQGPVYQKGGSVYNVKAFHAKCDGSSDSHAQIQAAVNAAINAGGGDVIIPSDPTKTCRISQPIVLDNDAWLNVRIIGAGRWARIQPLSGFTGTNHGLIEIGDGSNLAESFAIENLSLRCHDGSAAVSGLAGIYVNKAAEWRIESNSFSQCDYGVRLVAASGNTVGEISSNVFGSQNLIGVSINGGNGIRVVSNEFLEGRTGGGSSCRAIHVTGQTKKLTISSNIIDDLEGDYAIDIAAWAGDDEGLGTVSGNTIRRVKGGIRIQEQRCAIVGNHIADPLASANPAIYSEAVATGIVGNVVHWDNGNGIQIVGSHTTVNGNTITAAVTAIDVNGVSYCSIGNNTISEGSFTYGIRERNAADNNRINGNVVNGATTAYAVTGAATLVEGAVGGSNPPNTCASARTGEQYFDVDISERYVCNGTSWTQLDGGGTTGCS